MVLDLQPFYVVSEAWQDASRRAWHAQHAQLRSFVETSSRPSILRSCQLSLPVAPSAQKRPGPLLQHHGVNAGDTICLYRNPSTNELTVDVMRGAGPPALPAGASCGMAAAAEAVAAALGPQSREQGAVPTFPAGQLPGLAWTLGPRGGKRACGPAEAAGLLSCSAGGEEEDNCWAAGADCCNYGDYSPTVKGRGSKRGAKGPLAVRRALNKQGSGSSDGSDQVGQGGLPEGEQGRAVAACQMRDGQMLRCPLSTA